MNIEILRYGEDIKIENNGRCFILEVANTRKWHIMLIDEVDNIHVCASLDPDIQTEIFINDFMNNRLSNDVIRALKMLSLYKNPNKMMEKLVQGYNNERFVTDMLKNIINKRQLLIIMKEKGYYLTHDKIEPLGYFESKECELYGKDDIDCKYRIIAIKGTKLVLACEFDSINDTYKIIGLLKRDADVCISYIEGREVKFLDPKKLKTKNKEWVIFNEVVNDIREEGYNVIINEEIEEVLKTNAIICEI